MNHIVQVPDEMEEQQFAKEVLYAHVMARSVQLCAGLATAGTLASIPFVQQSIPIVTRVLTNNSRAVLVGLVVGPVMTFGRMQDQTLVDWQDRSWRLLQNPGQNNVDIGMTAGAIVCAAAAAVATNRPHIATRILGGAGIGSVAGLGLLAFLPADSSTPLWRKH
ncbi:unnamed protein product [Aphanomyces euteiches]|uniref:Uncharacterized protein n=1 Tax=Aphanomyces euteiches TaxID=100861 RepID=A0A6G0XAR9_9STRA|nr:hypothetical protein Ae201684_006831 [Aphanomyces euteiches]KAH9087496.1 hypothetical protein Ae201684P_000901 [Aphanomyces euteiches]KAH9140303.1 hypothetical protein AeRB84_015440 [Aphanomyces euteiches]